MSKRRPCAPTSPSLSVLQFRADLRGGGKVAQPWAMQGGAFLSLAPIGLEPRVRAIFAPAGSGIFFFPYEMEAPAFLARKLPVMLGFPTASV